MPRYDQDNRRALEHVYLSVWDGTAERQGRCSSLLDDSQDEYRTHRLVSSLADMSSALPLSLHRTLGVTR